MLETVNNFISNIMILAGVFLLTRYVFLEPAMEEQKQRIFYIVSFLLIILSYFLISDSTQLIALLLGGLNIALGRKKHHIRGAFLIIPLIGIINGIFAPIIAVQMMFSAETDEIYRAVMLIVLLMFGCVTVALGVFYFKGKEWRKWFRENMVNRRLRTSEYIIIYVTGILLLVGSNMPLSLVLSGFFPAEELWAVRLILMFYEMCAFLLTITIVVLIMQGNHRKFYHDRVMGMQFSVIATMADIVENRDSNTGGHIKRTAKYVEIIGRKLKKQNLFPEILTEQYLEDMIVAAPLHDIGKVSIPDAILNKPGRLTEEEYEIMKTHAAAGREVLQKAEKQLGEFDYLEVALDMAEYHHEWWNGNGYPAGISGEEIPLCARIMAVADVFDALSSKRCYKEAMPLEKAYGIIRSEIGTHFDPVVAEAFLDSKQEVEEAMRELADSQE